MKLIFISDTHGQHRQIDSLLLEGDILFHCGDFMTDGHSVLEAWDFLDWFSHIGDCKHRILIAGNHERLFEDTPFIKQQLLTEFKNIKYLQDSLVEVEGIKIYGTPYQPELRNWAFNLEPSKLEDKWAAIPNDIDILLTHTPPYGVLDEVNSNNLGCKALLKRVQQVCPKIHAFGHIHECPGSKKLHSTLHINAAQVDRDYKVVNKPITIDWP